VDPLEDFYDPGNNAFLACMALPKTLVPKIIFIDCCLCLADWLDSLIGQGGLLLVVSHLFLLQSQF
jgi:hypothetical protein